MHDYLIQLLHQMSLLAAPAIVQVLQGVALMTWGCACYAFLLIRVMPRVQSVDVSGWVFAGFLTLSVAGLVVCASFGIGAADHVLTVAGMSIAAILASVTVPLLGYKSVKVRAENPPPAAQITMNAPAGSGPAQAQQVVVTTGPAPASAPTAPVAPAAPAAPAMTETPIEPEPLEAEEIPK